MLSCIYTKKTKQCPKPWFIFIYNSITCWGFNTITIDLSPLDQRWQSCVWHVSHQKIINMKFKPTLFFAIICTLCLWFEYLKCLNNIRNKQPIQKEINILLSKNIKLPNNLLSHLDVDAIMLCTQKEDVDNYNNHMVDKLFQNATIYNVSTDSNAFETTKLEYWIHNPIFHQIKKVAIDVCVIH